MLMYVCNESDTKDSDEMMRGRLHAKTSREMRYFLNQAASYKYTTPNYIT